MDLFFYREPEELEKAEEAQAPFQDPQAVAAPGWGAEPIVSSAAPTPMEGFAAVDPAAVSMEYQAPPAQAAGLGGGWDADPAAGGEVIGEPPVPDVQEAIPVEAAVPVEAVPADAGAGGGWDAAPQQPAVDDGGWGDASGAAAGGW